jgi:hypothetical protein
MTTAERLKQILAATSMAALVSAGMIFLIMRYQRTAGLFGGHEISHSSIAIPSGENPVNDGYPRGDGASKRDLTIHFFREMPLSRFDGWVEIKDEAAGQSTLFYRGPYAPTITLQGVCYDGARPGGDEIDLAITLVTKHHEYFFHTSSKLPLGSTSEANVQLWVDHADVPRASIERVR